MRNPLFEPSFEIQLYKVFCFLEPNKKQKIKKIFDDPPDIKGFNPDYGVLFDVIRTDKRKRKSVMATVQEDQKTIVFLGNDLEGKRKILGVDCKKIHKALIEAIAKNRTNEDIEIIEL